MPTSVVSSGRAGILGFGVEGASVLRYLRRWGHRGVVEILSDSPVAVEDPRVAVRTGPGAMEALYGLEVLIRSPGFPPHHPLRRRADSLELPQTTATSIFLESVRAAGLSVVGVTGSKGKSTTSALLQRTLSQAGIPSILLGNIGEPALDHLEAVLADGLVSVLELSSYQCSDLETGPTVALLLELFPEHMDWHGSVEAYYDAKLQLLRAQGPGDLTLCHQRAAPWVEGLTLASRLQVVGLPGGLHFSEGWYHLGGEHLFPHEAPHLRGAHNGENACMALAATLHLGARPGDLQAALREFEGLPHRLADLGWHHGLRWFDDAISTAPEATARALEALGDQVETVIAGGKDRGYDYGPLAASLQGSGVRRLILLPDSDAAIIRAVRARDLPLEVRAVADLESAVAHARLETSPGATVLFSPGAPSYNQFRDFRQRGRRFAELVEAR